MRKTVIFLGLLLSACAQTEPIYQRVGGAASQFDLDKAACRGEAEKANMSIGEDRALLTGVFGMSRQMRTVYDGCMAAHGYLRQG